MLNKDLLNKIDIDISVKPFKKQEDLKKHLIEGKDNINLLILDYYLNGSELDKEWFEMRFPAVPKIYITRATSASSIL